MMPFGLTNAPATFQNLMNQVFAPFLRKFTLVVFDDIMVYSRTAAEQLQHLERQHQLFANNQNMKKKVACLGHVISQEGVTANNNKLEDMMVWPISQNIKALRGFLGFSGYYRKFVENYGMFPT